MTTSVAALRSLPVVPDVRPFGLGAPVFRRHSPCHTIRMTVGSDGNAAAAISQELASCRKRGIERIDVKSHNQAPVPTPELQRLADEYLLVVGRRVNGRIAQIKYLLHGTLSAF